METIITPDFVYLKPGGNKLEGCSISEPPPLHEGHVRVVCISDTHNEHANLNLPWGHLLVHAGDIMTESGSRHVIRSKETQFVTVKPSGIVLLEKFGAWLGSLPHPHKAFIGGNHDWVMQALGYKEVVKIIGKYCRPGSFVYLDHGEASVGTLKVFGSPYALWGGTNDAFMSTANDVNYNSIPENTQIIITHMPPILPSSLGTPTEDKNLVDAMHRVGALLHVGGHCHWAHGLYHTKKGHIPCVVASVSDSHWCSPPKLFFGPSGERGDQEMDQWHGGYNLLFPPIVCDIPIPGGPPPEDAPWITNSMGIPPNTSPSFHTMHRPTLLFFGPPTDPSSVKRLLPLFSQQFNVYHFDDVEEAIISVQTQSVPFDVCVSKLGSSGNLGKKLMKIIREVHGKATFIIVHSATATADDKVRISLEKSVGVNLFVDPSCEEILFKKLAEIVNRKNENGLAGKKVIVLDYPLKK